MATIRDVLDTLFGDPPIGVRLQAEVYSGASKPADPAQPFESADAAWQSAVDNEVEHDLVSPISPGTTPLTLSGYVSFSHGSTTPPGGGDPVPRDTYTATCQEATYRWRIYCCTNYFKIWWRERYVDEEGNELSSKDEVWNWSGQPSVRGYNLPAGFNINDPDTWSDSQDYEIKADDIRPADPTSSSPRGYTQKTLTVDQVRYSGLEGYDPPKDGSANGFPRPPGG